MRSCTNQKKTFDKKSIPEIADELACKTVRGMCKDGKLTPQGRSLAKLMDRIMPDEKVDEWGWNLSRKERAAIKRRAAEKKAAEEKKKAEARARAAYRRRQRKLEENGLLEGFAQINWAFMAARDELKRRGFSLGRGRNGRKSCARSSAANRGAARREDECGIISTTEFERRVL